MNEQDSRECYRIVKKAIEPFLGLPLTDGTLYAIRGAVDGAIERCRRLGFSIPQNYQFEIEIDPENPKAILIRDKFSLEYYQSS